MKTTIAIFLTIQTETPDSDGALNVVDDAIDAGYLQDAINEQLSHGERVTCAVVRRVPQALLEQYDASDAGSDGCSVLFRLQNNLGDIITSGDDGQEIASYMTPGDTLYEGTELLAVCPDSFTHLNGLPS